MKNLVYIKSMIAILILLITGCSRRISDTGDYTQISLLSFPFIKTKPFLYCGNDYFRSQDFIHKLNENIDPGHKVININSIKKHEASKSRTIETSRVLLCEAAVIYENNYKETGVLRIGVIDKNIMPLAPNRWDEGIAENLSILWYPGRDNSTRKVRIKELNKRIDIALKNVTYECQHITHYASGGQGMTTRIVKSSDQCGNDDIVAQDREVDELISEKVDLEMNKF